MEIDQTKTDLEWLLTRLGWRGDFYWDGNELGAFPPYDPTSTLTEEQWFSYGPGNYMDYPPRYDQDVNLMIGLVEGLTEIERYRWEDCMARLYASPQSTGRMTYPFWIANAPANLRLRAYRAVCEEE